mmetsp:Transcript_3444/g.7136  ORF Transcript_3444/g.7136 Transcript_3444/m.7136 type:complete len:85 (-) Transcript_3444:1849-2103(-)
MKQAGDRPCPPSPLINQKLNLALPSKHPEGTARDRGRHALKQETERVYAPTHSFISGNTQASRMYASTHADKTRSADGYRQAPL